MALINDITLLLFALCFLVNGRICNMAEMVGKQNVYPAKALVFRMPLMVHFCQTAASGFISIMRITIAINRDDTRMLMVKNKDSVERKRSFGRWCLYILRFTRQICQHYLETMKKTCLCQLLVSQKFLSNVYKHNNLNSAVRRKNLFLGILTLLLPL